MWPATGLSGEAIGVVTTAGAPGVLQQLWREGIRKEKES
jgi:hypothetical protein